MEAINKNKEEIEKIEKGCGTWNDKKIIKYCGQLKKVIWLCPTCKRAKQERIKTSILWCEDEMQTICMNYDGNCKWCKINYDKMDLKLKQLQTHLTYLKEQEKEI